MQVAGLVVACCEQPNKRAGGRTWVFCQSFRLLTTKPSLQLHMPFLLYTLFFLLKRESVGVYREVARVVEGGRLQDEGQYGYRFMSQTCPSSSEMPRLGHPRPSSLADKTSTGRLSHLSVWLSGTWLYSQLAG